MLMTSRFEGWPANAYAVLLRLDGVPTQQTMAQVRSERERDVRQPMIALLDDLAGIDPYYENFSVWRYATTPYWWQNQCATVRVAQNVEINLGFNLDGLRVQASWSYAPPEQIARFRAAVAHIDTGRQLDQLLGGLYAGGHAVDGERLARVPRGYPNDHSRADMLRHRSLKVGRTLDTEDRLHTSEPVLLICEQLRALLTWLADNVSRAP
jgi:uncharacterized protein (DUF2461 family)